MTSVAGAGCKCLLGNAGQLYLQDSSPTISVCPVVVCMFSFTHKSMDMKLYDMKCFESFLSFFLNLICLQVHFLPQIDRDFLVTY